MQVSEKEMLLVSLREKKVYFVNVYLYPGLGSICFDSFQLKKWILFSIPAHKVPEVNTDNKLGVGFSGMFRLTLNLDVTLLI